MADIVGPQITGLVQTMDAFQINAATFLTTGPNACISVTYVISQVQDFINNLKGIGAAYDAEVAQNNTQMASLQECKKQLAAALANPPAAAPGAAPCPPCPPCPPAMPGAPGPPGASAPCPPCPPAVPCPAGAAIAPASMSPGEAGGIGALVGLLVGSFATYHLARP